MTDFLPSPTYALPILVDDRTGKSQFNPIWLEWFLQLVGIINTAGGGGGGGFVHNMLTGLQGGAATEYYHLTSAEHAAFSGTKSANTVFAGPTSGGAAQPAFRALVTADLANQIVTYAKIQNVTDARLLGRSAGSAGAPMEITVGSGLSLAAGALTATGGGGGISIGLALTLSSVQVF